MLSTKLNPIDVLSDIEPIVDSIIDKSFKVPRFVDLTMSSDYTEMEQKSKDAKFTSPVREFNDLMTDFVVNEVYDNDEHIAKFLKIIITVVNDGINLYKQKKYLPQESIIFLFKGGGTMRMITLDYLHEQPNMVSYILDKYFMDYFKRSDADFGILIDPTLKNFEEVFEDMTNLSFLLLHRLNAIFVSDLDNYFNLFLLNEKTITNKLNKYLELLNNSNTLKDKDSEYYGGKFTDLTFHNYSTNPYLRELGSGRKYFAVDNMINSDNLAVYNLLYPNNNDLESSVFFKNIKDESEFYISVNRTLEFGDKLFTRFNLVRTKLNFNTNFLKNGKNITLKFGGELIDISISHKNSSEIDKFFKNLKDNIQIYTLNFPDKSLNFEYLSYSLRYFCIDLEKILFHQNEFPWDDKKYQKRIIRLLFLTGIDLLEKNNRYERNLILENLIDYFINFYNSKQDINQLYVRNNRFKDLLINSTFLDIFISNMLNNDKLDKNSTELKEFIQTVTEILQKLNETNNELNKYLNKEGVIGNNLNIFEQGIYKQGLFGGSTNIDWKKKYYKYKNKYIDSKK